MMLNLFSEDHGEPTLLLILKRACLVHKIWCNTLLLIEQYIYYRSVGCHSVILLSLKFCSCGYYTTYFSVCH